MTTSAPLPLAETSDMIALHRIFRDALAGSNRFVGSVADGDTDRAELVGSYYANVLELLHSHHEGEDELLTPRLLERMPEQAPTIERIAQQHQAVLAAVEAAEQAIATWRAAPSGDNRESAMSALAALQAGLTPHLDEEERVVLPIAAQCIDVAEWAQLPEHGLKTFGGDKLWLINGLVQEQMSPEQRASMEAHMPPSMLAQWNESGCEMFRSFITALRG